MTERSSGTGGRPGGPALPGRETWLIRGARPLGGDPADILVAGGVIAEIGPATGPAGPGTGSAGPERRPLARRRRLAGPAQCHRR